MSISKTSSGWLVDIQPGGRGAKRHRKTLPTKAEALTYEAWLKTKITQSPEWQPPKKDGRRLFDLVELWHRHHGMNLRAGTNTYSRLKHLCVALGNPFAEQFKPEMFANYRAKRMAEGISANNLNREHSYLRAVFNELQRLGYWKGSNPLAKVRQMKIAERELSFLSIEQIRRLLDTLSGDASLIVQVCLATGARWSEAEGLRVIAADTLNVAVGGLDVLLSVLDQDSRFKTVSRPMVRVRSGAQARFSVGQDVPVLGQATLDKNGNPVQAVEYKQSGVILTVTPDIRESVVDLDISQELSSFVATTTGVNGSPTLLKRTVNSKLSIKPGEVVIFAGLNEKKTDETEGRFFGFSLGNKINQGDSEILVFVEAQRI